VVEGLIAGALSSRFRGGVPVGGAMVALSQFFPIAHLVALYVGAYIAVTLFPPGNRFDSRGELLTFTAVVVSGHPLIELTHIRQGRGVPYADLADEPVSHLSRKRNRSRQHCNMLRVFIEGG
jgi:hypothetical protein